MDFSFFKICIFGGSILFGYMVLRHEDIHIKRITNFIMRLLLPYVIFVEIASTELSQGTWLYASYGCLFVLVPFFVLVFVSKIQHEKAALVSTAEGGTLGLAIYLALGTETLSTFLFVDMIGNGLAVFLVIFPFIMGRSKSWKMILNPLTLSMFGGLGVNLLGFHPLTQWPPLTTAQMYLSVLLIVAVGVVTGAGIQPKLSRDIFRSHFFVSFWVYRGVGLICTLWFELPLAVAVLFALPPSFFLPILFREQKLDESTVRYASNYIVACMPMTAVFTALLFLK